MKRSAPTSRFTSRRRGRSFIYENESESQYNPEHVERRTGGDIEVEAVNKNLDEDENHDVSEDNQSYTKINNDEEDILDDIDMI